MQWKCVSSSQLSSAAWHSVGDSPSAEQWGCWPSATVLMLLLRLHTKPLRAALLCRGPCWFLTAGTGIGLVLLKGHSHGLEDIVCILVFVVDTSVNPFSCITEAQNTKLPHERGKSASLIH